MPRRHSLQGIMCPVLAGEFPPIARRSPIIVMSNLSARKIIVLDSLDSHKSSLPSRFVDRKGDDLA